MKPFILAKDFLLGDDRGRKLKPAAVAGQEEVRARNFYSLPFLDVGNHSFKFLLATYLSFYLWLTFLA